MTKIRRSARTVIFKKLRLAFRSRSFLILFLIVAMVASSIVLKVSKKTFNISDGKSVYVIYSISSDIDNALNLAQLKSDKYQIMSTVRKGRVTNIRLEYTFPVNVTIKGETVEVYTIPSTVKDILHNLGVTITEHDEVSPAADTFLKKSADIKYVSIQYTSGSYDIEIPFKTETVTDDRKVGIKMLREGKKGTERVYYTEKWVDGVSVSRDETGRSVVSKPVNAKKLIGTADPKDFIVVTTSDKVKCISTLKPASPIKLNAKGVPVDYKEKITVKATAYTHTGRNCATGVKPQPGYIAVNTKYIPYGTKMYIVTHDGKTVYGYAVAADTGAASSNKVDLFMDTQEECAKFGRRNVDIYILE